MFYEIYVHILTCTLIKKQKKLENFKQLKENKHLKKITSFSMRLVEAFLKSSLKIKKIE